jgi:exosortase/archaeosortase family protein
VDPLTPHIQRRLFAQQTPWLLRTRAWRHGAVLLAVYGVLRLLLEWPAQVLHLDGLNASTAELARQALALLGLPLLRDGALLLHSNGFATEVHQTCTALIPAALVATAIALHREVPWSAKIAGIVFGLVVVSLANQLRLVGVIWVGVMAPAHFNLVHGWLAPAALAAVCLATWWIWWSGWRTLVQRESQTLAWPA